ncbi:MAG: TonB-dependent receptor [Gemmatimonadota bacterium]|nr:TonB-dependent receptor [Gemmatimonadota bacterium]
MTFLLRRVLPAPLALLVLLLAAGSAGAQSATTGAAAGTITDQDGAPLAGAAVELVYGPTGFRTGAITNERGAFTLQGLEPGGPYTARISLLGYRPVTRENISISLGQTFRLNARLEVSAVELEALVVQADPLASQFSASTQGTATTITQEQLEELPALDRRFENLARLTPQIVATDANEGLGLSVVGQNNRFNTIQIDGSTVNDRFGLGATGTAGGQARGKPIGFDAIKEFQVLLSPYDVRQGNFTGALINAITKSGGNEFFGSAFGFFRDENLAGSPLDESEFNRWQYGASLGGPIVRDRAFFFANAEIQTSSRPANGPFIGASGEVGGVIPDQADLDTFNQALVAKGLQPGDGGSFSNDNPLVNLTLRSDWNIDDRNRLVFRYSYNSAEDDVFGRTTSTSTPSFRLDNNAHLFDNEVHNPSVQLFTNFASGHSNELRLSWNRIRDQRSPFVEEPQITVEGFTNSANQEHGFRTGSEQFSQGNELDQDIFEITDNFTFAPFGNHTITIGTRNEIYDVRNLFAQSSFGVYEFDDFASFQDGGFGTASRYTVSGQLTGGPVQAAEFTSAQFGAYAQDQWQVSENLSLTGGLRVDIPVFFDQPTFAQQVIQDFDDPEVPSGQVMWNPRLGFNWDIDGEQTQQLRGGAGIFTGNPAFVWMSNSYSNNGTGISILGCGDGNPNGLAPAFNPDPRAQNLFCVDEAGQPTVAIGDGSFLGEVDIVGDDTRFPQVFRANLAYDRRLPGDFLLTLEGIYNTGIEDYFIVNRNFGADGSGASVGTDALGRVMYGTITDDGRSDPNYFRPEVYGTGSSGVFELLNTSENYSVSLTGGLQKQFGQDLRVSAFYTYSESEDVQSFTSSRATSNWRFGRVNAGDQLADDATTSSFDRPHKVTISGTYTFPWAREDYPTRISLIYIGNSGTPYTYISGGSSGRGDLNADGINANDPLYVITGPSDPNMSFNSPEDAQAYDALISSLSCLDEQRGRIMERNSCRNPWQDFLDVTLEQGLPKFRGNRLSMQLGIFNFLNLLDGDWGVVETAGGGVFSTQTVARVTDATDGVPNFDFSGPNVLDDGEDAIFVRNGDPRNSWQLQLSLRWEFGGGGR